VKIRRGRLRSTIKWGGAVLTVLLLVVWVGSARYEACADYWPACTLHVCGGNAAVMWDNPWTPVPVIRDSFIREHVLPFQWWFSLRRMNQVRSTSITTAISVPLWFLAILTAMPSFLIWRHDRKRDPNACSKCGYSRTGLPADRACPECGCAAA
jgi:hypothetical protein